MAKRQAQKFDIKSAREMADSFSATAGLNCSLLSAGGKLLAECGNEAWGCGACRLLSAASGQSMPCDSTHADAILQSERFGGRYIYFCPASMMFFASPILVGGAVAGGFVAGPVMSTDASEFLEEDKRTRDVNDGAVLSEIRERLALIPQIAPARVDKMSSQLFASAVLVSDNSHKLLEAQDRSDQQNNIGEYIYSLKTAGESSKYPILTEQNLMAAIERGDEREANRLLNEMLGFIFFFTDGNPGTVRTRIMELLVVLSRAAISGGANVETLLKFSDRYLRELQTLKSMEDVAYWLSSILNQYTGLVFDVIDIRHKHAIYDAVDYMEQNYGRHLTLEEVADHVGYSPAYFSSVFKREMHTGFKTYLNGIRIDRCKQLLLSGGMPLSEICEVTGFPDQSHFSKVFKQFTGVTPNNFRKFYRRIDRKKEHGQA